MAALNLDCVQYYVAENIGSFHQKRIESLNSLKLERILKKKNPYLYRAKNLLTAEEIVRKILDAHISSNEETIFGNWLEGLAIYINSLVYNGRKSGIKGIDLEFDKDGIRFIVNIKSGPNWGNSAQIEKMLSDFSTATRTLRTSNSQLNIRCVNGCCYGIDSSPEKGNYSKYCGQLFWKFISGDEDLFVKIIEPLGYKAKEKNDEFLESYSRIINVFTRDFSNSYCKDNGEIDWQKIVRFNSEA